MRGALLRNDEEIDDDEPVFQPGMSIKQTKFKLENEKSMKSFNCTNPLLTTPVLVFRNDGTPASVFENGVKREDILLQRGGGILYNAFGDVFEAPLLTTDDAPYLYLPGL